MYLLLIILMVIASLLMCFIVLIQNSKGGGLASGFSSSNAIMGVRKTTDFLEKATWFLAAFMVVMSIAAAYAFRVLRQRRMWCWNKHRKMNRLTRITCLPVRTLRKPTKCPLNQSLPQRLRRLLQNSLRLFCR